MPDLFGQAATEDRLLRITAPHFVAGVVNQRAAPIIRYLARWDTQRIIAYCHQKGWQVEVVSC